MSTKANQEERMLLYRLGCEIVNLPHLTDALDESSKLTKRDSSPVTTILDHYCKGAAM